MPMNSVNTNTGAYTALQNLNATSRDLDISQNRINTGKKINNAKDNGAIWAIAQQQRSEVNALNTVRESLARGASAVDVGLAAGESISDLLVQMKDKALAATDASLNTASRAALNEDYKALRDQITTSVTNASFNGLNMLNATTGFSALANSTGTAMRVRGEILSLGGANVTVTATASIGTRTLASAQLTAVNTSIDRVSSALSRLGTGARQYERHSTFVSTLSDALENGVGNLVDADLAKESARLQSLQTKQQLGVQALSIANQSSGRLLGLFR